MENAALPPNERLSPLQFTVAALCFLTILIDGFDTQSAAFAGPLLRQEFSGGGPQVLGLIFGSGLLGGLLGGAILGPLGDRLGRRPLLIAALCIMSAGSIASGFAHSAVEIALLRLLTGLGLGGAVPNVIALTAEYAPPRSRSTAVAIVFNGFPLGAMVGSIVGARLLPTLGWRSLFIVGGGIPLLVLVLVMLLLPESPAFLMRTGRAQELKRIVARLGRSASTILSEPRSDSLARGSVLQLFAHGLAAGTTLIWIGTLLSILCIYCTVNWLPVLIAGSGLPLQTAILAVGALNIGSVVGNLILARFGDRNTAYAPTAAFYAIGAVFLGIVGLSGSSSALMLSMTFGAGVFGFGGQLSVTTITARLYPTELRATGSGWSFAIGRVGGVIGPTFAGFLLGYGMGFATMMAILGALMLLAGLAILLLGRTRSARHGRTVVAEAMRNS